MSRKLCGVLVVVAVLGSVAVFAGPAAAPLAAMGLVPASQPPHAQQPQAQAAREAAATPGRAAPARQGEAVSPRQEQQRLRAQRAVAHQTRRLEQLEQALEAARKEGRTSDVAALEKALGRQRLRIERLSSASQALASGPAARSAGPSPYR